MAGLTIEGNVVRAVSPEGQIEEITVEQFMRTVAPPRMSCCGLGLPTGTRFIEQRGRILVLVHETPPQVRTLKWIASGSPRRWGGAAYRTVRLALPYMIVLAVFEDGVISNRNECFFRSAPLEYETDELYYPALLNCSRFEPPDGHPLSWICTQKMDRDPVGKERDVNKRIRTGFRVLMQLLLETGFNYSSEDHEYSSWFSESRRVDRRVASVEKWEAATEKEGPLFVLDLPWLPTGMSAGQVVERIFQNYGLPKNQFTCERDLARIVFNRQKGRKR